VRRGNEEVERCIRAGRVGLHALVVTLELPKQIFRGLKVKEANKSARHNMADSKLAAG
jgi:hypothetical protein